MISCHLCSFVAVICLAAATELETPRAATPLAYSDAGVLRSLDSTSTITTLSTDTTYLIKSFFSLLISLLATGDTGKSRDWFLSWSVFVGTCRPV